jgi:hypothetical protein
MQIVPMLKKNSEKAEQTSIKSIPSCPCSHSKQAFNLKRQLTTACSAAYKVATHGQVTADKHSKKLICAS